ncbi:hypothetical protein Taro_048158 [Colocasia esculenta]|uniref:Uncharacterized protein n=1 Tax=Colocasia esculenta TaxID=4460 RepID=A0A843X2B8_COLES|nr:hypothetical protein [Colocasia esculenta]
MESEVEEDHIFPSRSPLLQHPKLAAHDPNFVDTESSSVDIMLQTQGKMMKKWSSGVDTESSSVDTMLQTQGKMMKKWSSGVDTESSSVDTRPSSQRTQSTGLYRVSTQDQVVSTLETLHRNLLCQFRTVCRHTPWAGRHTPGTFPPLVTSGQVAL